MHGTDAPTDGDGRGALASNMVQTATSRRMQLGLLVMIGVLVLHIHTQQLLTHRAPATVMVNPPSLEVMPAARGATITATRAPPMPVHPCSAGGESAATECGRIQCQVWDGRSLSPQDRETWQHECVQPWPDGMGLQLQLAGLPPPPPPLPLATGLRCTGPTADGVNNMGRGCLPAFLGISCVHCGSSSLAAYLRAHPQLRSVRGQQSINKSGTPSWQLMH